MQSQSSIVPVPCRQHPTHQHTETSSTRLAFLSPGVHITHFTRLHHEWPTGRSSTRARPRSSRPTKSRPRDIHSFLPDNVADRSSSKYAPIPSQSFTATTPRPRRRLRQQYKTFRAASGNVKSQTTTPHLKPSHATRRYATHPPLAPHLPTAEARN